MGPAHFDIKKFGADFAYTLDGDTEGEIQYENFNAAKAVVEFTGVTYIQVLLRIQWSTQHLLPWNSIPCSLPLTHQEIRRL